MRAAAAAATVPLSFADNSEDVRLGADVSVELDELPAARPFAAEGCTEDNDTFADGEAACGVTAGVGVGSVKMVVVITEVVTDIIGGSVFAKGTDEAAAGVRVSIDTAVTVSVLGGIVDVSLNVVVTPGTARVGDPASVDECEPILEIPPRTEDLLQGVWCRTCQYQRRRIISYVCLGSSGFGSTISSEPGQAGCHQGLCPVTNTSHHVSGTTNWHV